MTDSIGDWRDSFFEMNPDAVIEEEEKPKKKVSTLTLDMELPAMDFCNKNFYRDLSDEHKKEISLWILMRYMSSSQNYPEHHLMMVNDLVNNNFNSLSKHPELQWMLLALCGTNRKQYHPWIAPSRGGAKANKLGQAFAEIYPLMKDDDIELIMKLNTEEEMKTFFKDNGYDDKTIKELFKGVAKEK
jgi:hypothetical protein